MSESFEDKVRHRAYEIWTREGKPHGHHDQHWERARREIEAEGSASAAALAQGGDSTQVSRRRRPSKPAPAAAEPTVKRTRARGPKTQT